uniref:Fatty-acid and retinol-binding protein 1 n=1 Tax=Panagrellus redivivus TaxID=6233 RepID=A0A7E4W1Q9_PANRE
MKVSAIVALSLLAISYVTYARPQSNAQYNGLVPPEINKFYNSLTAEDQDIVKDVLNNPGKFSTFDGLLEDLKGRSSFLYDKATSVISTFTSSLDGLGPEAKQFIDDLIERGRAVGMNISIDVLKDEVYKAFEKYKLLPPEARDELKNAFPVVTNVFGNPVFQMAFGMFFGVNLDNIPTTGSRVTVSPWVDPNDRDTGNNDNNPKAIGGGSIDNNKGGNGVADNTVTDGGDAPQDSGRAADDIEDEIVAVTAGPSRRQNH